MTVRAPAPEHIGGGGAAPPPEILFREARRRRRRRWRRALVALAVLAAAAAISKGAIGHGGGARASRQAAPGANSRALGTSSRSATTGSLCGSGAVAVTNCLLALSFVSSEVGFGVYTPGASATGAPLGARIVSTSDGGSTWHEAGPAPVGYGPTSTESPVLTFVDASDGIEYGTGGAFATHDGGRRWARVPVSGRVVASTVSAKRLWLTDTTCTVSPTTAPCSVGVEVSSDSGRTWRALELPPEPFRIAQTAFGRGGTLVVAEWADHEGDVSNDPGVLLVSADGGASWKTTTLPCPADYRLGGQLSLAPSSRTIWMVCSGAGAVGTRPNVVYRSTDMGASWKAESSYGPGSGTTLPPGAPDRTIQVLVARSSTEAWVLETSQGGLLATSDGGRSWHAMAPKVDRAIATLRDTLDMVTPNDAYLAAHAYSPAYRGGLWRTEDGGRSWHRLR
ncbi:MAG: WD40/YVTN/BNR-like repeat-containing protein [Acidimicrobiales bacterium]